MRDFLAPFFYHMKFIFYSPYSTFIAFGTTEQAEEYCTKIKEIQNIEIFFEEFDGMISHDRILSEEIDYLNRISEEIL